MTADELIIAVRDYANLSASAEDAQDAQILRALNREQTLFLSTVLAKSKGQHRQTTLSITVTSATRYFLPTRAIAAGIKMVEGVDSSGQSWMLYNYNDDEAARFGRFQTSNGDFYVEGNELVFYQAPPSGTLRVTYSRRLSTLVLTTSAAVISTFNNDGIVTIAAVPTTGDLFGTGATSYDFVKVNPHFDILAMDKSATRSGTTLTFSPSAIPSSLAAGDYVALAKQTPVCQAPLELHPLLALRTAYVWSRAKNDPIASVLEGDLKEATALAATLLEPRMEQEAPLVNRYAPGRGGWPFVRGAS